jgi:hypothetical protein
MIIPNAYSLDLFGFGMDPVFRKRERQRASCFPAPLEGTETN